MNAKTELLERLRSTDDFESVLNEYTITKRRKSLEKRILDNLKRTPGKSMSQLQNDLRPHSKSAVFDKVQELCEAGVLYREFPGGKRPKKYAVFRVSGAAMPWPTKSINQTLDEHGIGEECITCEHYAEDREVNFFGCECRNERDCVRIDLNEVDDET